MHIGTNMIISCPNCGGTMIIANPTKQDGLLKQHKIVQKCEDCKKEYKNLYYNICRLLATIRLSKIHVL